MRCAILTALVLLATLYAGAQEVHASIRVDSNSITIGDWLKLYVEVEHPSNVAVAWPILSDSLDGLEIVHRSESTKKQAGDRTLESATFTITAFDSGTFFVPPLPFQYSSQNDTAKKTVATSPVLIRAHGVLVDTTKDIKDIKPPMTLPISFAELLPYLIVVVVIIGLGIALYYYMRNKRLREMGIIEEIPSRPAHEVALEALRSLEAEHLWQRGKVKEYYSTLTDIVRTYIERKFFVKAMEITTDEIMFADEIVALDNNSKESLKEILVRADLVKFAKFLPVHEENEKSISMAISFVESTHQEQTPVETQTTPVEVQE